MSEPLRNINTVICDLDGTVWRWNTLKDGVKDTIDTLKDRGKSIRYITNSSLLSRDGFATKLQNFGIETEPHHIISGSYIAARTLAEKEISHVYAIGEEGLFEEFEKYGIGIREQAQHVVSAIDRNVTYWKLATAIELIRQGATHWACGNGQNFPFGDRTLPSDKAINTAIAATTGVDFELLGKPSEYAKKIFLKDFKVFPGQTMLIGDDIDSDIAFGNMLGVKTGLVLGGETTKAELKDIPRHKRPTFVFRNFSRVVKKIE